MTRQCYAHILETHVEIQQSSSSVLTTDKGTPNNVSSRVKLLSVQTEQKQSNSFFLLLSVVCPVQLNVTIFLYLFILTQ